MRDQQLEIAFVRQLSQRLASLITLARFGSFRTSPQFFHPRVAIFGRPVHGHGADQMNSPGRIFRLSRRRGRQSLLGGRRNRRQMAKRVGGQAANTSIVRSQQFAQRRVVVFWIAVDQHPARERRHGVVARRGAFEGLVVLLGLVGSVRRSGTWYPSLANVSTACSRSGASRSRNTSRIFAVNRRRSPEGRKWPWPVLRQMPIRYSGSSPCASSCSTEDFLDSVGIVQLQEEFCGMDFDPALLVLEHIA